MENTLRFFFQEPILGGAVIFCLAIVGFLMLSDWREKRRSEEFLRMRNASRRLNQGSHAAADANGGTASGENIVTATDHRPVFRLFRWEFVMLSIVLTVFLVKSQRSPRVEAKSPPVTATAPAETISPADSQAAVAGVNSADALSSAELESAVERGPIVPDENSLLGIRSETPVDAHSLFQFETRADREGIQSDVHKQIRGKIDGAGSPLGGAPFAKP